MIEYLWYDGTPVSEAEFRAEFGAFEIWPGGLFEVIRLKAVTAETAFQMRVLGEQGTPLENVPVVYSWPDAPALPGAGWDGTGLVDYTDFHGDAKFPMGIGEYYYAPAQGPGRSWLFGGNSDCLRGIGMLGGTDHYHFNAVVQVREGAYQELEAAWASAAGVAGHIVAAIALLEN